MRRPTATTRYEALFLPGLDEVVRAEIEDKLKVTPARTPGRDDSMSIDYDGRWDRLAELRTVVAVFAVMTFAVPRPKSLLSGEYFPDILRTVDQVIKLNRQEPARSFRFEAAGSDSAVYQRLAQQLSEARGLRFDPGEGDIVLRFRRSTTIREGWDVLVRLTTRPLSHRTWRVRNFPGAVNATVAAAIVELTHPRPQDRVVNLMCGSGTLIIERLLAGPARTAIGVDLDEDVLEACAENLAAAGLTSSVTLLQRDIADPSWTRHGPFDVLLADPPWGGLVGQHSANEELHLALLQHARPAASPKARFAVLTHEVRIMERCLRRVENLWTVESVTRVFQKGHHPRIYLMRPV